MIRRLFAAIACCLCLTSWAAAPKVERGTPTLDVQKLLNWDLTKALHRVDGMRLSVSLDQLWEFSPVDALGAMPRDWGYFMVPGDWNDGYITNYMHLGDGARVVKWDGKKVEQYPCAWYRREINVPADWKDKQILLCFENIMGKGSTLFVNGKEAASGAGNSSLLVVDLGGLLKFGADNEIAVFVAGSGETYKRHGLLGDVWLKTLPKVNLGEPKIVCSFRQRELSLQIDGQLPPGTIELTILDLQGKAEASRSFNVDGSGRYVLPWLASKLWSPGSPSLYKAEIILKDASGQVLDRCERRFGFREFYVENGGFMLNGNPFLLKFDTGSVTSLWTPNWQYNPDYLRCYVATLKAGNLNGCYVSGEMPERFFELADELGLLLLPCGKMPTHEQLDQQGQAWKARQETDVKRLALDPRLRNHPSVIGILIDIWYNYHAGAQNPEFIGLKADQDEHLSFSPDGKLRTIKGNDPNMKKGGIPAMAKQRLDIMAAIYRKQLPEFELFTGGSGEVGNIYASHLYHTWGAPLSEMTAFFERWKQQRDIPIFIGETIIPYIASLFQIDNCNPGTVPFFLENGARFLGQQAYRHRGVYTTHPSCNEITPDSLIANTSETDGGVHYTFCADIYQRLLDINIRQLYPYWRADGVTGFGTLGVVVGAQHPGFAGQAPPRLGPLPSNLSEPGYKPENTWTMHGAPFHVSPSDPQFRPLRPAFPFRRAMADVSFFLAGPESDYYLQDHSGFGGETLEKSAVVFNNAAEPRKFKLDLQLLTSTGATLSTRSLDVEAKPFERKLVPFSIELPKVASRQDLTLKAVLLAEDGTTRLEERFALQVFPKPQAPELSSKLYVFDPEGVLGEGLDKLDVDYKRLKSLQDLPATGTLLVGRKALSLAPQPFNPQALAERGLNVLVLEQTPEVSPELLKSRQRIAFLNDASHPALASFKDCDFANWNGSHTVGAAYSNSPANVNWSDWGARNMVATYVFRRPSHGNFISLLASGFDLHQTPLLEYRGAKGCWIACQLDLTERLATSPVPTLLLLQLLDYLDKRGQLERAAAWFGDAAFGKFVDKFGIQAKRLKSLSERELAGVGTLLLSDCDFPELIRGRGALGDFVYWGGKVVFLQRGGSFSPEWLPFTMKLGAAEVRQVLAPPGDWQSGWSDCELYFHDPVKIPVFEGFPPQATASVPAALLKLDFGGGSFLFTSVLPERFGGGPAAGKASRLLSALLTAQGVGIANASQPFVDFANTKDLDLSELKWEFATDPDDKGLKEGVQNGANGSFRWLKGLIADGVEVRVGQPFGVFLQKEYLGVAWYKIEADVPAALANEKDLYFVAGAIDDFDTVYVNGVKIGATDKRTPKWWEVMRAYRIPPGLLKAGANSIVVRVFNDYMGGGIVKGPVKLSTRVPVNKLRVWATPYPDGVKRDYDYKPDIVRMY